MMRSAHILLLTPGFPAGESDDGCIPALQEYVRAFSAAHPEARLTVVALQYPFTSAPYRWNTIDVHPLGGSNSVLAKPLLWYRAVRQAESIHAIHPVSVIHSFWLGECAMAGAFIANRTGTPHVCTLMGQEMRKQNRYAALLRNGPTRFFALTPFQDRDLEGRTGRHADGIIPWGVAAGTDADPGPGARDIDLLGAGSFGPLKNFGLFLSTAAAAAKKRPALRCVIAGDGPDRARIESLIGEYGLEKNVTLTGMIPRHEVLALMQRSKILLHPSLYEGFGYVFAEALACGMEIVSFEVGAARPHPRWHVAASAAEFPGLVERALDSAAGHPPLILFPIRATVDAYAAVYGLADAGEGR